MYISNWIYTGIDAKDDLLQGNKISKSWKKNQRRFYISTTVLQLYNYLYKLAIKCV